MSLSNTFFLFGEVITDQYCWNQNIREIACPSVSNLVDVCSVNDKSLAWSCQEKHIQFDHCKCWLGYKGWQSLHVDYFPHIPVKKFFIRGKICSCDSNNGRRQMKPWCRPRLSLDAVFRRDLVLAQGYSLRTTTLTSQLMRSLCKHFTLDFFQPQVWMCFCHKHYGLTG